MVDAFQTVFGELGEEGFIDTICPQLPDIYTALNAIVYQGGEAKTACKKWFEAEKINLNIFYPTRKKDEVPLGRYIVASASINSIVDIGIMVYRVMWVFIQGLVGFDLPTHVVWRRAAFQRERVARVYGDGTT